MTNSSTLNSTNRQLSKSKSHSWNKCTTNNCKHPTILCYNKCRSWPKRASRTTSSRACSLRTLHNSICVLIIKIQELNRVKTRLLDALTKTEHITHLACATIATTTTAERSMQRAVSTRIAWGTPRRCANHVMLRTTNYKRACKTFQSKLRNENLQSFPYEISRKRDYKPYKIH